MFECNLFAVCGGNLINVSYSNDKFFSSRNGTQIPAFLSINILLRSIGPIFNGPEFGLEKFIKYHYFLITLSPSAIWVIVFPVDGFIVGNVLPEIASTN